MGKHAEIIERLEKATGPSRELDGRIGYIFDIGESDSGLRWRDVVRTHDFSWAELGERMDRRTSIWRTLIPHYTASLDATIALVERKLPGCMWSVSNIDGPDATIWLKDWAETGELYGPRVSSNRPENEAIALLIAMFRALESKETDA